MVYPFYSPQIPIVDDAKTKLRWKSKSKPNQTKPNNPPKEFPSKISSNQDQPVLVPTNQLTTKIYYLQEQQQQQQHEHEIDSV